MRGPGRCTGWQRPGFAAPALGLHAVVQRHAALAGPRCWRGVDAAVVVLAGQQAKRQRRIGQQAHAQAVAGFVQPVFPGAVDQAVRPHRGHARQAVLLGQAHNRGSPYGDSLDRPTALTLPACTSVASASTSWMLAQGGLAGVEIHLAEHGQVAGGPVNLVQVDHIGSQAAQAAVAGIQNFSAGQPDWSPRIHGMPRDGPATLVASTTFWRTPGLAANQWPMMVSWPRRFRPWRAQRTSRPGR